MHEHTRPTFADTHPQIQKHASEWSDICLSELNCCRLWLPNPVTSEAACHLSRSTRHSVQNPGQPVGCGSLIPWSLNVGNSQNLPIHPTPRRSIHLPSIPMWAPRANHSLHTYACATPRIWRWRERSPWWGGRLWRAHIANYVNLLQHPARLWDILTAAGTGLEHREENYKSNLYSIYDKYSKHTV